MLMPESIDLNPIERDESADLVIENAQQDESGESLTRARSIIDGLIQFKDGKATSTALDQDIAAWHTPEIIGALALLSREDKQAYTRIKSGFKQFKIATDIDNAVKAHLRASAPKLNPVAALLNQIKEPAGGEPILKEGELLTARDDGKQHRKIESEAAALVASVLKNYAAFDPELEIWFIFTGKFWNAKDGKKIILRVLARMLYAGCGCIGFKNSYLSGILAILQSGFLLSSPSNADGVLPFDNGLLDITTRRLLPISPQSALTWALPYPYAPKSDCPTIKKWLKWAVDDDLETVELIRAFMAAVLHRRYDLQKFLHLIGPGGTGKSTLTNLIIALVGSNNTVSTSFKALEEDKFEASRLYLKLLAVITDSERNGGSLQKFKAATGGDPLRYEVKHIQSTSDFVFKGLFVVISNEHIQNSDNSSGLERRRVTVYFSRRVSEDQKLDWQSRGGEAAVLHRELPGLVNWLLELSQDQITRTIQNPPDRTKQANFDAMIESNSVAAWLVAWCVPDASAQTQVGEGKRSTEPGEEAKFKDYKTRLYPSYCQWASRNGKSPVSSTRFKNLVIDTVQTLGFSASSKKMPAGIFVTGVRIRKDWEHPEPIWRGQKS